MGQGLIVQLNTLVFSGAIRLFFAPIVKFLFYLIENAIDVMYELAGNRFGLGEEIQRLAESFFSIFVIYMIFRLTLSMLNYIVNPDSFSDKSAGFSKLILKVVISLVLLVSINPIFELMYNIQDDILFGDNNVIDNLILGEQEIYTVSMGGEEQDIYVTRMSDDCPPGYNAYSMTKGGIFSIMALKPFYQPTAKSEVAKIEDWEDFLNNNETGYCGINFEETEAKFNDDVPANIETLDSMPHTGSQYINHRIYEKQSGDWDANYEDVFIIDFRSFWAFIFGIVVLLLIITYCFDVVIRTFTLFLYQVIAPIPIISFMSPDKKNSDMLSNWAKKTVGCWASLFVRFIVLDFVIYFAQIALNSFHNDDAGLVVQLFTLLGLLMFAKKLPKLIEELIPGLKFPGMQLNPFKRISQEALGGNAVLGAGAAVGAAGLSGLTNFGQRAVETGQNVHNAEGWRNKLSAFGRGARRTAGSTIAGAASGGINAFGRTSKDGKIFSGAWNGYQTSMYSKLLREDNRRKGGTALGSIAADLHRYTGTLNRGQQEGIRAQELDNEINAENARITANQEALDTDKRNLAERKRAFEQRRHDRLESIQAFHNLSDKLLEAIDRDDSIQNINAQIEEARKNGGSLEVSPGYHMSVDDLKAERDLARQRVSTSDRFRNNANFTDMIQRLENLQAQSDELRNLGQVYDANNGFNADLKRNSTDLYERIDREFNDESAEFTVEERGFERRQDAINADKLANEQRKQTAEYITTHDQSSPAKVDNATRMNRDVQPAGATFSAERPAQSRMYDNAYYSGFNNQNRGGGGRPPGGGPPPGGGHHGGPH